MDLLAGAVKTITGAVKAAAPKKAAPKTRRIYLDNNATTFMPRSAIVSMNRWVNRGNPSAEYAAAREARKMMDAFRASIALACGFAWPAEYDIIFTSGGSEANCHIVNATTRAFRRQTKKSPHIVISAVEHKSLAVCCDELERDGLATVTRVAPAASGRIEAADVQKAIQANTCLVSIMAANNESGIVNDLKAIGKVAAEHKIPFHSDAVQIFGKEAFRPAELGVDAFSVSFHKLHGPAGVGALVIRQNVKKEHEIRAHICGSQNGGLRGGTENIPGIAGAFDGFTHTMTERDSKTAHVAAMRNAILEILGGSVAVVRLGDPSLKSAVEAALKKQAPPTIIWLVPKGAPALGNTLFVSVVTPGFCNKLAREALDRRGIIISIGAACNTAESKTSSVVEAMGVPEMLWPGVLRISLGDETSPADARLFAKTFLEVIQSPAVLLREAR